MKARRAVIVIVALLIGGAAVITSSYRDDIEAARERVERGARIVETPCGPIEYAVAGDGPAVLSVHGAGGGYDQGMLFGAALAETGFRVIAMSRFGYLGTPLPPDASAAAQADAHACLLDALARPAMIRGLLATPPEVLDTASAGEQARVEEMLVRILPVSPRRLGLLNDAAITSNLERYELERVVAPTLVVSVEDDLFGTFDAARYTAEHIPGARFAGCASGGHVWVGHHQELMAEIEAFLR